MASPLYWMHFKCSSEATVHSLQFCYCHFVNSVTRETQKPFGEKPKEIAFHSECFRFSSLASWGLSATVTTKNVPLGWTWAVRSRNVYDCPLIIRFGFPAYRFCVRRFARSLWVFTCRNPTEISRSGDPHQLKRIFGASPLTGYLPRSRLQHFWVRWTSVLMSYYILMNVNGLLSALVRQILY